MADYVIKPVTADLWGDMVELFGPHGAAGGCWCMFWRIKGSEYSANGNRGNKAAMKKIVAGDEIPGLLAYSDGKPVGWISLGPREIFGRIRRSPTFKAIDDRPVWSVVCFFIHEDFRGCGVGKALLRGAEDYARAHGARLLESYPVDTRGKVDPAGIFTGTQRIFESAGYAETARRKPRRPMMRKELK
ncbi:MAG: GNAT family N-acetyltransferase [Anaerolineales bacterium]